MRHFPAILTILFLSLSATAQATIQYETCVLDESVKTLRLRYDGTEQPERPILTLGGSEVLEISFDQLSHSLRHYTYTLLHLNADRTQSALTGSEYISGFTTQDITDYDYSFNTHQLYTHYRFFFPNDDMQPAVSGNYALKIYEDGDPDKAVAYVCFCVVEPMADIDVRLRTNTDIELAGRYQQLDIDVSTVSLNVTNPADELKLIVQQNGRFDNLVYAPRPTYVESGRLRWLNCRNLIFEGGNEYRHFDLASVYIYGQNVDHIEYDRNVFHAFLYPDETDASAPYLSAFDKNGQYAVHAERTNDSDYEADYMWVHFLLPRKSPWFDGSIFIGGDLSDNAFTNGNRMSYDNEHQAYYGSLYLKQGAYDYQYFFLGKGSRQATLLRTEGSHWQTQNEYTIMVYYRPFGARADRLIGFKRLQ
ncbi:MAG: DUF5103 domain-containing protein [Paludibacteraceae bacterium]|nr:DUF5103 domain-containing protein [Paludibacteraceae bacterium]